jgi:transposase
MLLQPAMSSKRPAKSSSWSTLASQGWCPRHELVDTMPNTTGRPRRTLPAALKAKILAACAQPGASSARIALDHGISADVVHCWSRMAEGRERVPLRRRAFRPLRALPLPSVAPASPPLRWSLISTLPPAAACAASPMGVRKQRWPAGFGSLPTLLGDDAAFRAVPDPFASGISIE